MKKEKQKNRAEETMLVPLNCRGISERTIATNFNFMLWFYSKKLIMPVSTMRVALIVLLLPILFTFVVVSLRFLITKPNHQILGDHDLPLTLLIVPVWTKSMNKELTRLALAPKRLRNGPSGISARSFWMLRLYHILCCFFLSQCWFNVSKYFP